MPEQNTEVIPTTASAYSGASLSAHCNCLSHPEHRTRALESLRSLLLPEQPQLRATSGLLSFQSLFCNNKLPIFSSKKKKNLSSSFLCISPERNIGTLIKRQTVSMGYSLYGINNFIAEEEFDALLACTPFQMYTLLQR